MGNIVGKLCTIILGLYIPLLHAHITMRITDVDGDPLEHVSVGVPWILIVSITDLTNISGSPVITGLDQFQSRRIGVQMNSINNNSTVMYTYQVRSDTPGEYTIGPATLVSNGNHISSDTMRIIVSDQPAKVKKTKKHTNTHEAFLELTTNKKQVVVGEKIICTLRFYINDNDLPTFQQIQAPQMKEFVNKNIEGPYVGTEQRNNIQYTYAQWQWQTYIQESGTKVIPAIGIDFTIPLKQQQHNGWNMFDFFLGSRVESKRVYSNACTIKVDPLPAYHEKPVAIGRFTQAYATVLPAKSSVGEGIVLTLTFEGDADMDSLQIPPLQNMPKELRFYESKNMVIPLQNGMGLAKKYEFVIQGLAQGTYTIPAQSFLYFDVDDYCYKTIQTQPIDIFITPGVDHKHHDNPPVSKSLHNEVQQLLCPIHEGPRCAVSASWALPWWLVIIVVIIPLGLIVYRALRVYYASYWYRYGRNWYMRNAFAIARKQLKRAHAQYDGARVYHIFIQLIAQRMQCAESAVSLDMIERALYRTNISDVILREWTEFSMRIESRAFGQQLATNDRLLFEQAYVWLDRLKDVV